VEDDIDAEAKRLGPELLTLVEVAEAPASPGPEPVHQEAAPAAPPQSMDELVRGLARRADRQLDGAARQAEQHEQIRQFERERARELQGRYANLGYRNR